MYMVHSSKVANEFTVSSFHPAHVLQLAGSPFAHGALLSASNMSWICYMWQVLNCCSVAKSWLTFCDPMGCSTPGFSVPHHLLEFAQVHVHWISDATQPSHPGSSPSPFVFNLSQHQGLFQWVNSSNQVAKVLELQFQHQSFQWIFRTENTEKPWLK